MKIEPFKLERYFDKYEFTTQYLLSSSDCDGYSLEYVFNCATPAEKKLFKAQPATPSASRIEALINTIWNAFSDMIDSMAQCRKIMHRPDRQSHQPNQEKSG